MEQSRTAERDALIIENMDIARYTAYKYHSIIDHYTEPDDIIAIAYLALTEAASKYLDYSARAKSPIPFSAYAVKRIKYSFLMIRRYYTADCRRGGAESLDWLKESKGDITTPRTSGFENYVISLIDAQELAAQKEAERERKKAHSEAVVRRKAESKEAKARDSVLRSANVEERKGASHHVQLSYSDRLYIAERVAQGGARKIADGLGVHISTIYRELKRGTIDGVYSAEYANGNYEENKLICKSAREAAKNDKYKKQR